MFVRSLQRLPQASYLMKPQNRLFSTLGSGSFHLNQKANQFIVCQPKGEDQFCPTMQLRYEGPIIKLYNEMTLKDLERTLKLAGEAKNSVEFFDQDGSRIASSSKIKHILEMSNFKMNIDVSVQYHCHSVQGFTESISVQTP